MALGNHFLCFQAMLSSEQFKQAISAECHIGVMKMFRLCPRVNFIFQVKVEKTLNVAVENK